MKLGKHVGKEKSKGLHLLVPSTTYGRRGIEEYFKILEKSRGLHLLVPSTTYGRSGIEGFFKILDHTWIALQDGPKHM